MTILVDGALFVAAFAAIVGAVIMYKINKRLTGQATASGFKNISVGVLFIALGIGIDAVNSYIMMSYNNFYSLLIFMVKGACFVIGTYIIVIASKQTSDKLEKSHQIVDNY